MGRDPNQAQAKLTQQTINDGDLMLVDVSDDTIAEGKVYVFSATWDIRATQV